MSVVPGHLVRALRDEHAVIEDLLSTVESQHRAVSRDDIDALNDSVFAAHRLLGAYREARSRRRSAVTVACGGGDGNLEALEQSAGSRLSAAERAASTEVRAAAKRLVAAIGQNQRLLQAGAPRLMEMAV